MALGDISAVLDTLEFDTTVGYDPNMVHVSGDVYACAYGGASGGFVVTFTIDSSGNIGNAVIDSLEFAPGEGVLNPMIISISGDVFAIVYSAAGQTTKIVTVDIDSSGNIGAAIIDSLTVSGSANSYPRIVAVSGDIYAVDHSEPTGGTHGEVFTVDIDSSGNIGAAAIDTLAYGTDDGVTGDIINISGTMFAVATRNSTRGGSVYTFNIAADGTIDNAATDSHEFDSNADCLWFRILNVSGDVYVITYTDGDDDGFARTLTIGADGTIGTVIDSLEFDTVSAYQPYLVSVSGDVFAVAYSGRPVDITSGLIKTFTITSSGFFSSVLGTLEFESVSIGAFWPTLILITGSTIVCVGYQGVDGDGFAKTALVTGGAASVTYPTDAITRVTSLKHIYNREAGIFDLEIGLGEVAADFAIPDIDLVSKSASTSENKEKEIAGIKLEVLREIPKDADGLPKDILTGLPRDTELPPIVKPGGLPKLEGPKDFIGGILKEEPSEPTIKGGRITNTPQGEERLTTERQRMRELRDQGLSREEIDRIIAAES